MTTMDKVRNAPTTLLAGEGLKEIAHTAEGIDDAPKVFSLISYGLQAQGVKLQAVDPMINLDLDNQLASATRVLSDMLAKMPSRDPDASPMESDGIKDALRIAVALDSISDNVIRTARSFGQGCCDSAASARVSSMIQDFKESSGDIAFQARNLADLIMDGVGLNLRDADAVPDLPSVTDCGCSEAADQSDGSLLDVDAIGREILQTATLVSHKQLGDTLAMVDTLAPRIVGFLGHSGEILCDGPVEVGLCDDVCKKPTTTPTLARGKIFTPKDPGGNVFIPTFTVDWTRCLKCSCFKYFSQNLPKTVTTTHTATPTIPATRPKGAAEKVARTRGNAEVKKFQASLAPAAPPYVPSSGIKPPLAIPTFKRC